VVIASSDLLKTAADDRGFLKRAGEGWGGVDEILLPAEPAAMRKLIELASYRPPPRAMMPDFMLRDFIQVQFCSLRPFLSLARKSTTHMDPRLESFFFGLFRDDPRLGLLVFFNRTAL
jgi:hypothetical protein